MTVLDIWLEGAAGLVLVIDGAQLSVSSSTISIALQVTPDPRQLLVRTQQGYGWWLWGRGSRYQYKNA